MHSNTMMYSIMLYTQVQGLLKYIWGSEIQQQSNACTQKYMAQKETLGCLQGLNDQRNI